MNGVTRQMTDKHEGRPTNYSHVGKQTLRQIDRNTYTEGDTN